MDTNQEGANLRGLRVNVRIDDAWFGETYLYRAELNSYCAPAKICFHFQIKLNCETLLSDDAIRHFSTDKWGKY